MSSIIQAAKRRRVCLLASSFLVPIVSLGISAAHAQQSASADQLPAIEVNPPKPVDRNRVEPSSEWASRLGRVTRAPTPQTTPAAQPSGGPAPVATTAIPNILAGASTTVITAEEIAHSPAQTVQEIIAQVPGVQLTSLFGAVNGAQTTVDLRGFGATAVFKYPDPHQWPQGERHRHAGRGSLHDSTRFDPAHRNHQRQQRRGALRRQCHGRGDQHRHQDRSDGPAAGGARRGRRRVLRPAPGRSIGFRECGTVVNVVLRQADQLRWIPRQQQTRAA